jgi:hypothetical protein
MSKLNRVTRPESFKIYELLKKNGIRKPDNIYEYNDGWDDDKIAAAVGPSISRWSVKNIRAESFGIVRTRSSDKKVELERRVEDLEKMVAALSDVVSKLSSQPIGTGVSKGPFVEKTLSFGEF